MPQRMERMLGSLAANLQRPGRTRRRSGRHRQRPDPSVWSSPAPTAASPAASTPRSCARRGAPIRALEADGKNGEAPDASAARARDALRRDHGRLIVESRTEVGRPRLTFEVAQAIARAACCALFAAGEFDRRTIVYNRFRSAITQIVTKQQLIPFAPPADAPPTKPRGTRRLRVRAGRGRDPGRAAAAQSRGADLSPRCSRTPPASRARA